MAVFSANLGFFQFSSSSSSKDKDHVCFVFVCTQQEKKDECFSVCLFACWYNNNNNEDNKKEIFSMIRFIWLNLIDRSISSAAIINQQVWKKVVWSSSSWNDRWILNLKKKKSIFIDRNFSLESNRKKIFCNPIWSIFNWFYENFSFVFFQIWINSCSIFLISSYIWISNDQNRLMVIWYDIKRPKARLWHNNSYEWSSHATSFFLLLYCSRCKYIKSASVCVCMSWN